MNNWVLNTGILFETLLAAFMCYTPGLDKALRVYPLLFWWWLPALPFSLIIWLYDEGRRFLLRKYPGGKSILKNFCHHCYVSLSYHNDLICVVEQSWIFSFVDFQSKIDKSDNLTQFYISGWVEKETYY